MSKELFPCYLCWGTGELDGPCPECHGTGYSRRPENVVRDYWMNRKWSPCQNKERQ